MLQIILAVSCLMQIVGALIILNYTVSDFAFAPFSGRLNKALRLWLGVCYVVLIAGGVYRVISILLLSIGSLSPLVASEKFDDGVIMAMISAAFIMLHLAYVVYRHDLVLDGEC